MSAGDPNSEWLRICRTFPVPVSDSKKLTRSVEKVHSYHLDDVINVVVVEMFVKLNPALLNCRAPER